MSRCIKTFETVKEEDSHTWEGKKEAGPPRAPLRTYIEVPSTGQRRPALPRASPAVPSALGGLASGFGMGPGVPRPPWPLTGGRRSAHHEVVMCVRADPRALGAAQRGDGPWDSTSEPTGMHRAAPMGAHVEMMRVRARAISAARLRPSPTLHLRPIDQVFYLGPYQKEN